MDKLKVIIILRVMILISALTFLIMFNAIPKTHCQACHFKIGVKEVSIEKFIELYYDKCVYPFKQPDLGINISNSLIEE